MEITEKIPSWFQNHPAVEAHMREAAAETLAKRQAAADRLEQIRGERQAGLPEQEAALASVLADLDEAQKSVVRLKEEADYTHREIQKWRLGLDHRQGAAEYDLLASYDSRIDEAQEFFREKITWLLRPERITTSAGESTRNLVSWKKTIKSQSNFEAVREALQFCKGAVEICEAWKLVPEYPEAELEALKAGIPSIDNFQEYTGERPLPKENAELHFGKVERLLRKRAR